MAVPGFKPKYADAQFCALNQFTMLSLKYPKHFHESCILKVNIVYKQFLYKAPQT